MESQVVNKAIDVDCRFCKQSKGEPCRYLRNGDPYDGFHQTRMRDYAEAMWSTPSPSLPATGEKYELCDRSKGEHKPSDPAAIMEHSDLSAQSGEQEKTLIQAVENLFSGGFIEAECREYSQWAQELEARLIRLRVAQNAAKLAAIPVAEGEPKEK
jgi:hypothetical protein